MSFYKNIHNILTPKDYEEVINGDNVLKNPNYGYISIETYTYKDQTIYALSCRYSGFLKFMFVSSEDMLDIYNTCKSHRECALRIGEIRTCGKIGNNERHIIIIEKVGQKLYDPIITYLEVICIDPKELQKESDK